MQTLKGITDSRLENRSQKQSQLKNLVTVGTRQGIRALQDCILRIKNCEVGSVKHIHVLEVNDYQRNTEYLKIGKVIYDQLRGGYVSYVVGMASAGSKL